MKEHLKEQRFIQEKIGSKNGPFTKIGDLKTDPAQKLETFNTNSKIKNYNAIFHTCSAATEFIRKLLKNFTKLHFSQKIKTFSQK